MRQTHLLVIDPQNDFTDPNGALSVPGGDSDIRRLSQFLDKHSDRIDDIHVTLDSHREVDIAHPIFWVDSSGNHPKPFSRITSADLAAGTYLPKVPAWGSKVRSYVEDLERQGRYDLTIWPPHCIIGSWGHAVHPQFSDSLRAWERKHFAIVNYVTKGSNIWTEHYSALKAEVEDPADPTTQLNTELIDILANPDVGRVLIAGEALSHCVANTVRDIADQFGEANIAKLALLRDCCSNVPGCEALGEDFVNEMSARGMTVLTTADDPFLVTTTV